MSALLCENRFCLSTNKTTCSHFKIIHKIKSFITSENYWLRLFYKIISRTTNIYLFITIICIMFRYVQNNNWNFITMCVTI